MADLATLDEVIDAFLEERIDFARFSELLDAQPAIQPGAVRAALARLEILRQSGQLSPGLCALVAQVLVRGDRSRDTAPIKPPLLVNTVVGTGRPAVAPGVILGGRYRLEALLQRGGMGVVYRAADLQGGTCGPGPGQVSVKVANPDFEGPGAGRALEREAALLVELSHPGVVRMLGFGHEGGLAYMIMELLEGERLSGTLLRSPSGALPVDEAIAVIRALAEILAYLHRRGVAHRDIKPANVFLTSATGVRLVDFGLAARVGESDRDSDGPPLAGTPLYASPEMLAGAPADPRQDVYSLACVAYELLAGAPPEPVASGNGPDSGERRLARPPGLTGAQWDTLQSALSPEPADRPMDAAAFLESFFARPRRRILPWAAAALVAGVIIGVGLAWVRPASFSPAPTPAEDSSATLGTGSQQSPASATLAPAQGPVSSPEPARAEEPGPAPAPEPEPERAAESASLPQPTSEPSPAPPPAPASAAPAPAAAAPARAAPPPPAQTPPAAASPARPAGLTLSAGRMRISEAGSALRLELRRPAGYRGPLRVSWRTVDQSARDGRDFIGSPAWTLAEAPANAASLVIFIPIVNDSVPGPDVTFLVEIRAAPQGPPVGAPARAQVTIVDDD